MLCMHLCVTNVKTGATFIKRSLSIQSFVSKSKCHSEAVLRVVSDRSLRASKHKKETWREGTWPFSLVLL